MTVTWQSHDLLLPMKLTGMRSPCRGLDNAIPTSVMPYRSNKLCPEAGGKRQEAMEPNQTLALQHIFLKLFSKENTADPNHLSPCPPSLSPSLSPFSPHLSPLSPSPAPPFTLTCPPFPPHLSPFHPHLSPCPPWL